MTGVPLQIPAYPHPHGDAISWDLAFEISTNEPSYEDDPKPGDVNRDGRIDLADVAIVAANYPWSLAVGPWADNDRIYSGCRKHPNKEPAAKCCRLFLLAPRQKQYLTIAAQIVADIMAGYGEA